MSIDDYDPLTWPNPYYPDGCSFKEGCPHHYPGKLAFLESEVWPEGRKDDQEKIRLELIPPSLITAVGTILTFGANKYQARNWEKGIAWGRVFGALMRHLWAWWRGEKADPETSKSHLWHAACCITFLIEYETTHTELDDRPYKEEACK
jgi:hypothetical protein